MHAGTKSRSAAPCRWTPLRPSPPSKKTSGGPKPLETLRSARPLRFACGRPPVQRARALHFGAATRSPPCSTTKTTMSQCAPPSYLSEEGAGRRRLQVPVGLKRLQLRPGRLLLRCRRPRLMRLPSRQPSPCAQRASQLVRRCPKLRLVRRFLNHPRISRLRRSPLMRSPRLRLPRRPQWRWHRLCRSHRRRPPSRPPSRLQWVRVRRLRPLFRWGLRLRLRLPLRHQRAPLRPQVRRHKRQEVRRLP